MCHVGRLEHLHTHDLMMTQNEQENESNLLVETGSQTVAQWPEICIELHTYIIALITWAQQ